MKRFIVRCSALSRGGLHPHRRTRRFKRIPLINPRARRHPRCVAFDPCGNRLRRDDRYGASVEQLDQAVDFERGAAAGKPALGLPAADGDAVDGVIPDGGLQL